MNQYDYYVGKILRERCVQVLKELSCYCPDGARSEISVSNTETSITYLGISGYINELLNDQAYWCKQFVPLDN